MKLIINVAIISSLLNTIFSIPFTINEDHESNLQKQSFNENQPKLFNWERVPKTNWVDMYLAELNKLRKRNADFNEITSTTANPSSEFYGLKNLDNFLAKESNEGYPSKPNNSDKFPEKKKSDGSDSGEESAISYNDSDYSDESYSYETNESDSVDDEWSLMKEGDKKTKRSNNFMVPNYRTKTFNPYHDKRRLVKTNNKPIKKYYKTEDSTKKFRKQPKNLEYETNESYSFSDDGDDCYNDDCSCNTRNKAVGRNPQDYKINNYKKQYGPNRRYRRDVPAAITKRKQKKFIPKEFEKKTINKSDKNVKEIY